jgi:hypothetical protein
MPPLWAVSLLFTEVLFLGVWMKPGPLLRYLTLPLQVLIGWGRYSQDYRPAVRGELDDNNQLPK